MINVYQRFANTDMDEGRGRDVALPGLFTNMHAAEQAAIGKGVYGSPAIVKPIPVFDTVDEFNNHENAEARRVALAKLTAEDRRALGL